MVAAGCGNDEPAARESFGVKLQTATCTDWQEASPEARQSAVDQLERTTAGPRNEGNTLEDDVAYRTLEVRCQPTYARGFLLYRLYTRAAGFESATE